MAKTIGQGGLPREKSFTGEVGKTESDREREQKKGFIPNGKMWHLYAVNTVNTQTV